VQADSKHKNIDDVENFMLLFKKYTFLENYAFLYEI
jgi:hypothetical protein